MIGRMCEHYVARAARAVPARRALAVHRAARAVRDRRASAGARRGSRGRPDRLAPRHRARSATTRARDGRRGRDDRGARPPPAAVEALDARASPTPSRSTTRPAASRSATTATSARSARGGPATGPRAGSTAGPTRRSARAGSRTPGTADAAPVDLLGEAPRDVRRPGEPRRRSTPTARLSAYAGNTENPVFTFRLGRIGLACTGIYSLDRSALPVRRARGHGAASGPRRRHGHAGSSR